MIILLNDKMIKLFAGESTVIWKQSNRIISAGDDIIRKDARLSLNDGFSLRIDGLREEDEGDYAIVYQLSHIWDSIIALINHYDDNHDMTITGYEVHLYLVPCGGDYITLN